MPEFTSHPYGNFCWTDLSTPDPEAAKAFYGKLFGWTFQDTPANEGKSTYTLAFKDGKAVGGLALGGGDAHWSVYVCVENADKTAANIKKNGGTVLLEPLDVEGTLGRMLVASDPDGAVFCCWQPGQHTGAQVLNEVGSPVWWELYVHNPSRCVEFYAAVFAWTSRPMVFKEAGATQQNYRLLANAGSEIGGVADMKELGIADVPPHWMVYLGVPNADEALSAVESLGGRRITDLMDVPDGIGRFAVVADPTGAAFTIFASGRAASA